MYTPTSLHIAPKDIDAARTLALRFYDDDAIIALDFDDANNPYVITDEGQVITLTNAASEHGKTPDVNWVMYDNEADFAHRKHPVNQGTISYATIAIDIYDLV